MSIILTFLCLCICWVWRSDSEIHIRWLIAIAYENIRIGLAISLDIDDINCNGKKIGTSRNVVSKKNADDQLDESHNQWRHLVEDGVTEDESC